MIALLRQKKKFNLEYKILSKIFLKSLLKVFTLQLRTKTNTTKPP